MISAADTRFRAPASFTPSDRIKCKSCGSWAKRGGIPCSLCGTKTPPQSRILSCKQYSPRQNAAAANDNNTENHDLITFNSNSNRCSRGSSMSRTSGQSSASSFRVESIIDEYVPIRSSELLSGAFKSSATALQPNQHQKVKCGSCGCWTAKVALECRSCGAERRCRK